MPLAELFSEIEPYDCGRLDVGDGNRIYWETCGNPAGKPAVFLHGGPGAGCSSKVRRFFDPHAYRIVLFDQRGSARSRPHASDLRTDMSVNTTDHLLRDIDRLREHLGIDRWLVVGRSWGSTLALAYAERHRERVTELILVSVTTFGRVELEWASAGVVPLFPAEWERFRAGAIGAASDRDIVEAYWRLLHGPDPTVRAKAARDWCEWESALVGSGPGGRGEPWPFEPAFDLALARIMTHYIRHRAWLDDGALVRDAGRLRGLPGVMIHGRIDLAAPAVTAWELAKVWPDGQLVMVDGAAHSTSHPAMVDAIVMATNRFRESPQG